jgi:hypothetical protein
MNRLRFAIAPLLALALGACSFDLFHDTSWETACDLDPATPGCAPDAASGQDGGDASDAAPQDVQPSADASGDSADGAQGD